MHICQRFCIMLQIALNWSVSSFYVYSVFFLCTKSVIISVWIHKWIYLVKLRIWSHLLKKPLKKNFIFCAVHIVFGLTLEVLFWGVKSVLFDNWFNKEWVILSFPFICSFRKTLLSSNHMINLFELPNLLTLLRKGAKRARPYQFFLSDFLQR